MDIGIAPQHPGDVLIYEYGVRLDRECLEPAWDQISRARSLYNDLVACIRSIMEAMRTFVMEKGGEEAKALQGRVDGLNAAFAEAKARSDEAAMKEIAQERRLAWRESAVVLKSVRAEHREALQTKFLSRIGKNSVCETYALRSKAVREGLGWATANAVLDAALLAFRKSFVNGRPPRFAKGSEKTQDTLTLQFTAAGGVESTDLLSGRHTELAVLPIDGCGRRKYGEFRFRLGTAGANTYATGTWQYHRPLPEGCRVGLARLVRRQIGKDQKWALQLMVKLPEPVNVERIERRPLMAVHFGWAADLGGRRIGATADAPDPGLATLLRLPTAIEEGLDRAAQLQSARDVARDELVPVLKEIDASTLPDVCLDEFLALRRLPVQHIAVSRLHRFHRILREAGIRYDWFDNWRSKDRLTWQSSAHIARRARFARRDFYRKLALDIARRYEAIVIEPLDLQEAAKKIDDRTGERSEFGRKARSGRVVAALYELESALRWAAIKTGSAVLEIVGKTTQLCAHCGGETGDVPDGLAELECKRCGAVTDRKLNGAAVAWQATVPGRDALVESYHSAVAEGYREQMSKMAERKAKMAAGRSAARTRSHQEKRGGSRANPIKALDKSEGNDAHG
jgi:hypothetical protein